MKRKCRKIAVMELSSDVTRGKKKRSRRSNGERDAEFGLTSSTTSTTSCIQLRSGRNLMDNRCLSRNLDRDGDDVSCFSSSIGSSDKRIIQLSDLEDESIEVETSTELNFRERRETTLSSEFRVEPEDSDHSMSMPLEANSRDRSPEKKMPTEAELEEFFAAAEKKVKKQFVKKYNYDIVEDKPLEGRYEWVQLNQ